MPNSTRAPLKNKPNGTRLDDDSETGPCWWVTTQCASPDHGAECGGEPGAPIRATEIREEPSWRTGLARILLEEFGARGGAVCCGGGKAWMMGGAAFSSSPGNEVAVGWVILGNRTCRAIGCVALCIVVAVMASAKT